MATPKMHKHTIYTYNSLRNTIDSYYKRLDTTNSFLGYRKPTRKLLQPSAFIKDAFIESGKDIRSIQGGRTLTLDKLPDILQLFILLTQTRYKNEMFYQLYKLVSLLNNTKVGVYNSIKYKNYRESLVTLLSSNKIKLDDTNTKGSIFDGLDNPKENLLQLIHIMTPYQMDPVISELPDSIIKRVYSNGNGPAGYDESQEHETNINVFRRTSVVQKEFSQVMRLMSGHNTMIPLRYNSTSTDLNNMIDKLNKQFLSVCVIGDIDKLTPEEYIRTSFLDELRSLIDEDRTMFSSDTDISLIIGMLRNLSWFSQDKQVIIPFLSTTDEYISVLTQIKHDIVLVQHHMDVLKSDDVLNNKIGENTSTKQKRVIDEIRSHPVGIGSYDENVRKVIDKNTKSMVNIISKRDQIIDDINSIFFSVDDIISATRGYLQKQYTLKPLITESEMQSFMVDMDITDDGLSLGDEDDEEKIRDMLRSRIKDRFLSSIRNSIEQSSNTPRPQPLGMNPRDCIIGVYDTSEIKLLQRLLITGSVTAGQARQMDILNKSVIQYCKREKSGISVPKRHTLRVLIELTSYINVVVLGFSEIIYTIDQYLFRLMVFHKNKYPYFIDDDTDEAPPVKRAPKDGPSISELKLDDGGDVGSSDTSTNRNGEQYIYKMYIQDQIKQTPVLTGMIDELNDIYEQDYSGLLNYSRDNGILGIFISKYEKNMIDIKGGRHEILVQDGRYDALKRFSECGDDIEYNHQDESDGMGESMVGLFSFLKVECINHKSQQITDFLIQTKADQFSLLNTDTDIIGLREMVSDTFKCPTTDDVNDNTPLLNDFCDSDNDSYTELETTFLRLFDYHDIGNTTGDFKESDKGFFLSNDQILEMYQVKNVTDDIYKQIGNKKFLSNTVKTYLLEEHSLFTSLHEHGTEQGVMVFYKTGDIKERILSLSNFLECIDDFHRLVHDEHPMLFMRNMGFIEDIEKTEMNILLKKLRVSIDVDDLDIGDLVTDSEKNTWVVSRNRQGKKIASIQTLSESTMDNIYSFDTNMIKEFNNKLDLTGVGRMDDDDGDESSGDGDESSGDGDESSGGYESGDGDGDESSGDGD